MREFVFLRILSLEAVIKRLSDAIEGKTIAQGYQHYDLLYQGEIQENEFEIYAIKRYRSLFFPRVSRKRFSPVIKGEIQSNLDETLISVTMAPPIEFE